MELSCRKSRKLHSLALSIKAARDSLPGTYSTVATAPMHVSLVVTVTVTACTLAQSRHCAADSIAVACQLLLHCGELLNTAQLATEKY